MILKAKKKLLMKIVSTTAYLYAYSSAFKTTKKHITHKNQEKQILHLHLIQKNIKKKYHVIFLSKR